MLYEYTKIEQIHSIAQCPERWSHPLRLLLQIKNVEDLHVFPVLSEQSVVEIIPGREYVTELFKVQAIEEKSDLNGTMVFSSFENQTIDSPSVSTATPLSVSVVFSSDCVQATKD